MDLKHLFEHTLKDIYNSENQILQALPQMESTAQSPELKAAIRKHIGETQQQIERVKTVGEKLGIDVNGVVCAATVGLIKEAKEHLEEFGGTPAGDAAIIASAQKVEHYEIANYGTVITWAEELGYKEVAQILQDTLAEEEDTDKALSQIAKQGVNQSAESNSGATLL
ncbi:ferritin-like domain-containing protein [bacterium]|nr:MAG: ferritin-like domain-containing protein [bacterium]